VCFSVKCLSWFFPLLRTGFRFLQFRNLFLVPGCIYEIPGNFLDFWGVLREGRMHFWRQYTLNFLVFFLPFVHDVGTPVLESKYVFFFGGVFGNHILPRGVPP